MRRVTSAKRGRWVESPRQWLGRDRLVGVLTRDKGIAPPLEASRDLAARQETSTSSRTSSSCKTAPRWREESVASRRGSAVVDASLEFDDQFPYKDHDVPMRSPITTRATVPPSTHAAVQDNMAAVSFDCPSNSRSALLMVRPGLATDGCRAQYRLSPLLAQTVLWWNTVIGYRLWCFAPLVGFADSAAAQPQLLRSLVSLLTCVCSLGAPGR